jgi:hypothetical protein
VKLFSAGVESKRQRLIQISLDIGPSAAEGVLDGQQKTKRISKRLKARSLASAPLSFLANTPC